MAYIAITKDGTNHVLTTSLACTDSEVTQEVCSRLRLSTDTLDRIVSYSSASSARIIAGAANAMLPSAKAALWELRYAYPTSDIAVDYGSPKEGLAYLKEKGGRGFLCFPDGDGTGIKDAAKWAANHSLALTQEAKQWLARPNADKAEIASFAGEYPTSPPQHDQITENHYKRLNTYRDSAEYAEWAASIGHAAKAAEGRQSIIGARWEINEEIYNNFLEMLPPMGWKNGSFYMSEFTFDDITTKYTKEGNRYYCEFAHYPPRTTAPTVMASAPAEQPTKTDGQLAYEADVAATPKYPNGDKRRAWDALSPTIKDSWERNPTPRKPTSGTGLKR